MKHNFKDITGSDFGYWHVVSRAPNDKDGNTYWNCQCVCGTERVISGHNLRRGYTTNCGCMTKKLLSESHIKHGGSSIYATSENTKLYKVWNSMRSRCKNETSQSYSYYGGRGINICEEWDNSFEAFRKWSLDNGYKIGLTIDRINVNGDYCPENCRWVDRVTQANNTTRTRYVTYNGETRTIKEWSEITGINYNTLVGRLYRYHWPVEDALGIKVWGAYHGDKEKAS